MKNLLVMLLATSLLALNAEAARNQKREHRQQDRIEQGVKSGELTKREVKKLRKGQKRVDQLQKKDMADGSMSPEEKAKLEKVQDHQSKQIYKQKHDDQERKNSAQPVPAPSAPAPQSPDSAGNE